MRMSPELMRKLTGAPKKPGVKITAKFATHSRNVVDVEAKAEFETFWYTFVREGSRIVLREVGKRSELETSAESRENGRYMSGIGAWAPFRRLYLAEARKAAHAKLARRER